MRLTLAVRDTVEVTDRVGVTVLVRHRLGEEDWHEVAVGEKDPEEEAL